MRRNYDVNHIVKSWPASFSAAWYGEKNHEIRFNDRDYKAGQVVRMQEFDPEKKSFSGRKLDVLITYFREGGFGLHAGFCVWDFVIMNHWAIREGLGVMINTNGIFRDGAERPPLVISENPED